VEAAVAPLTILKVMRDGKRIYAVLDGSVGVRCKDTYHVGQWAMLKVKQGGHFPLVEFVSLHKDVQPEALEGWEVEKI
jgi:hypothetical protein